MFNVEKNKPESAQLYVAPVDSPDNLYSLSAFLDLVGSCSGPSAGVHMIRNTCGGHLTMTSDSGRLLASLSLSRQVLKLIVSSVQGHLREYGDGGKFLCFACLSLINSTLKLSGQYTNRRAFCSLNEQFVKIISKYLNSRECNVIVNADLSNVQVLLAYTKSILSTRPLLNLVDIDCNKISELIVKCFVESIPEGEENPMNEHSDGIFIVGCPFEHSRESKLLKGLLLEHPELPCVKGEVIINLMTTYSSCKENGRSGISSGRLIKVALVTCSMSGDLEDIVSATYEVTAEQAASVETLALGKWTAFCEKLAFCRVGLLLCQKVIHPRLKILLKAKNVMAIDRLGSAAIPYIRDLTGARPIVSVIAEPNPESLVGYISGARHVIMNDKSFLHLQHLTSSLVSLILCSRTEEILEEFKSCVKGSLRGLYSLLKEGKLLSGAGCWQINCSFKLDEEVRKCLPSLAETVGCSQAQVLSALSLFRSSVFHCWVQQLHKGHKGVKERWDLLTVDPVVKHCWTTKNVPLGSGSRERHLLCCCGLKTSVSASSSSDDCPEFHSFIMLNGIQDSNLRGPSLCSENEDCDKFHSISADASKALKCPYLPHDYLDNPVSINSTLDHFSAATQGLYKAVFTANLVLSLGQAICDKV